MSKIKNITGVIKGIKKGYTGFAEFLGKNQAETHFRKSQNFKSGPINKREKIAKGGEVIATKTSGKKPTTVKDAKEVIYPKKGLTKKQARDRTEKAKLTREAKVKARAYDLGNRKIKTVGKTTLVTGYGVSEYEDSKKKALKRMKGDNNG